MTTNMDLIDQLSVLDDLVTSELSDEENEHISEHLENDAEAREVICSITKMHIKAASRFIDADRMGELVIESGIDPEFYDKYLAPEQEIEITL